MRHAKSSWDHPNLEDHERPLSKRGKKNAKKICEFFVKKKYKFDYILLSSSKRNGLIKEFMRPKALQDSKE